MKAVHFGAGNIGRGFVGLLLHEAGYEVVFADVNSALIDALSAADSYRVIEVGEGARTHTVTGFRAVDSGRDEGALVDEIASADVVTTAVGPSILRFVAPVIAKGLERRGADAAPLVVMACENAIGATDQLRAGIESAQAGGAAPGRAVYANTAVDRIVPAQAADAGLDVTVEAFHEWVIESGPFEGAVPSIPGATFVDDLEPFIERKLFTVNTGHAATAYLGRLAGAERIAEAIARQDVHDTVEAVLKETSALLVAKHELDPAAQDAYREKILARFRNEHLPDTVERVGRAPLRKLSRHERFIGPAAEIAERGGSVDALLTAVGAALRFDVPEDEESVRMLALLAESDADAATDEITGLDRTHPLRERVRDVVRSAQG